MKYCVTKIAQALAKIVKPTNMVSKSKFSILQKYFQNLNLCLERNNMCSTVS